MIEFFILDFNRVIIKMLKDGREVKNSYTRAWIIWSIAAIFYLYEMILRVSPSVMTNDLMAYYDVTSTMLGVLISCYYYSYTLLQVPCGLILDKLGPRNLIALSSLFCAMGSLLFSMTNEIYIAQIGRFFVGAGSACAFISCLQIATSLFPKKYFVLIAGITNMMGTLGGLFGGLPVAKSVNSIGWQNTTLYLSLFGIFLIILVFIFIPKKIEHIDEDSKNHISIVSILRKVIINKQVILSGLIAGFMYLPISAFSELWAVPFFMTKYNVNNEIASIASAVLFVGVAIGSIILAIVAKKIQSYMKTIRFSAIGVAILFIPLIYISYSIYISFSIVFIIGLLTGAQVINFTCAKNNSTLETSGTTIAFTNGIVMLIGSVFQPILGVFLDFFWNGSVSESGMRVYEISTYQKTMLILPICLIISYVLSLYVRETITTEKDD